MLTYKGYTGHMEVDEDAGIIFGRVIDIRDVITFKGETVEEAIRAFHESVDDYLDFCEEIGQEPSKAFSGQLPYRTTPEGHKKVYLAAKKEKKSINAWMDEVLTKAAEKVLNE
jgi:predicted HicB family RNase H-like nuclease